MSPIDLFSYKTVFAMGERKQYSIKSTVSILFLIATTKAHKTVFGQSQIKSTFTQKLRKSNECWSRRLMLSSNWSSAFCRCPWPLFVATHIWWVGWLSSSRIMRSAKHNKAVVEFASQNYMLGEKFAGGMEKAVKVDRLTRPQFSRRVFT